MLKTYNAKDWNYAEALTFKGHYLNIGDVVVYTEDDFFESNIYKFDEIEFNNHINRCYKVEKVDNGFVIKSFEPHSKSIHFKPRQQYLLGKLEVSNFSDVDELVNAFDLLIKTATNFYANKSRYEIVELIKDEKTFKKGKKLMTEHVNIMW